MHAEKASYVFVSHASHDAKVAKQIVVELERRGVPCWFAPKDLPLGVTYPGAIMQASKNAGAIVLLLSKHASRSTHVLREVAQMDNPSKPLFTLVLDDDPPSDGLAYYIGLEQHLDLKSVEIKGGIKPKTMDMVADELKRVFRGRKAEELTISPAHSAPDPDARSRRRIRWWMLAAAFAAAIGVVAIAMQKLNRDAVPTRGERFDNRPTTEQTPGAYRNKAVVIGISQYQKDGSPATGDAWRDLPSAKGDAEALAGVLEETYGYEVTRLYDQQATRGAVLAAVDALAAAGPATRGIVCFAGHGTFEESRKEGYWIPSDARKSIDGRPAREDWIRNSTIHKIINASELRQILVIADACYAGALFQQDDTRGETPPTTSGTPDAPLSPARFLIASGGMEEVPDGGNARSAFMKEILDLLNMPRTPPLTAQQLGHEVRDRLQRKAGRSIAVGPLVLPATTGGHFVFAKKGFDSEMGSSHEPHQQGGYTPSAEPGEINDLLAAVLALNQAGVTNAALRLLARASTSQPADKALVKAVSEFIDRERQAQAGAELRHLIESIKTMRERQPVAQRGEGAPAPRILACIGPSAPPGSSPEVESRVLLCRLALQSSVRTSGRAVVVERECLEQIMREMQLGDTDLSDPRTRLALGRILQAGIMLFGEYLPGDFEDAFILRLVDTETTQILDSMTATVKAASPVASYEQMGKSLVTAMIRGKPVSAPLLAWDGATLRIGAGRLHGVAPRSHFDLYGSQPGGTSTIPSRFARAVVQNVADETSDLVLLDGEAWGSRDLASARAKEVVPDP